MINLKEVLPKRYDGVLDCMYQGIIQEIINILEGAFKHVTIVFGYVSLIRAYLPGTSVANTSNNAAVTGW
jgi:hypothetical protein